MRLIVLTGASGSGKTTIAKAIASKRLDISVISFDSIGIPSCSETILQRGSLENWQRTATIDWFRTLRSEYQESKAVLFEGQMRIAFIREAAGISRIDDLAVALVDCDDPTRHLRLSKFREQPELMDHAMINWARYLRQEAKTMGVPVMDTSSLSVGEASEKVESLFS